MSKTRSKLLPWIRRQLAREPLIVRLRLYHAPFHGRGGLAVDDVFIANPRPESLSPESIADELAELAHAHASTFGGRQAYQVSAFAEGDEVVCSTAFAVTVESEPGALDATSEPRDMRSFGAMASRHAEQTQKATLNALSGMMNVMTNVIERLDRRCEAAELGRDRLHEHAASIAEQRLQLEARAAELRTELATREENAELKTEAMQLLMQAVPVLLPTLQRLAERLLPPKKRRAKAKRKKQRARTRKAIASPKSLEVVS